MDRKIYKINQWVTVNTDNPTPVKDNVEVAINILPINKGTFENFVLMIDAYQNCCECWGTGKTIKNGKHFLKTIEMDVKLPKKIFNKEIDIDFDMGGYVAVKFVTNKGKFYAWVFNKHNGYYSHSVYWTGDKLKVDTVEENYL